MSDYLARDIDDVVLHLMESLVAIHGGLLAASRTPIDPVEIQESVGKSQAVLKEIVSLFRALAALMTLFKFLH
jgi:signal transduction histidine kinase